MALLGVTITVYKSFIFLGRYLIKFDTLITTAYGSMNTQSTAITLT